MFFVDLQLVLKLLADEKKTGGSRNVALLKDAENIMDEANKKRTNNQENGSNEKTY